MRVLVTGGAGFIGSHVVDAYISEGHEVAVIDDLSSGRVEVLNPKAHFFNVDIRLPKKVAGVISRFKPEVINHHAAHLVVVDSVRRPVFDAEVNILGLLHVVQSGVSQGLKKVIFASSGGALYGECETPADESSVVAPLSPYGVAKWASEQYLQYYAAQHGLSVNILRYANVYGPRQSTSKESGVIALFCSALKNNQPICIYGNGSATRDYVFVEDVAAANTAALNLKQPLNITNIATSQATSVVELVKNLESISGKKFSITHQPLRMGEIQHSILSPVKAKLDFEWEPKTNFLDGLQKTWEWYTKMKK